MSGLPSCSPVAAWHACTRRTQNLNQTCKHAADARIPFGCRVIVTLRHGTSRYELRSSNKKATSKNDALAYLPGSDNARLSSPYCWCRRHPSARCDAGGCVVHFGEARAHCAAHLDSGLGHKRHQAVIWSAAVEPAGWSRRRTEAITLAHRYPLDRTTQIKCFIGTRSTVSQARRRASHACVRRRQAQPPS